MGVVLGDVLFSNPIKSIHFIHIAHLDKHRGSQDVPKQWKTAKDQNYIKILFWKENQILTVLRSTLWKFEILSCTIARWRTFIKLCIFASAVLIFPDWQQNCLFAESLIPHVRCHGAHVTQRKSWMRRVTDRGEESCTVKGWNAWVTAACSLTRGWTEAPVPKNPWSLQSSGQLAQTNDASAILGCPLNTCPYLRAGAASCFLVVFKATVGKIWRCILPWVCFCLEGSAKGSCRLPPPCPARRNAANRTSLLLNEQALFVDVALHISVDPSGQTEHSQPCCIHLPCCSVSS